MQAAGQHAVAPAPALTPRLPPSLQSLVGSDNFMHILRVLNTNVDGKQKIMYALTAIRGIGRRFSNICCKKAEVDLNKRCAGRGRAVCCRQERAVRGRAPPPPAAAAGVAAACSQQWRAAGKQREGQPAGTSSLDTADGQPGLTSGDRPNALHSQMRHATAAANASQRQLLCWQARQPGMPHCSGGSAWMVPMGSMGCKPAAGVQPARHVALQPPGPQTSGSCGRHPAEQLAGWLGSSPAAKGTRSSRRWNAGASAGRSNTRITSPVLWSPPVLPCLTNAVLPVSVCACAGRVSCLLRSLRA